MTLDWTRQTLDNGLDVIVHEDHRCPIVAVNLWYHVGSRNESPGRTGLAHLFEHLMFEGSLHHDRNYFTPLQRAGGAVNGSTSCDRTNYWEVVPANALDLALWLESDRMGYLLPALTAEKFENQRDVVLNERRQQYENRPYGLALMALMAALFPPGHPYRWTTIGEVADIRAATLDDAHAFFRAWYRPGNASLTVAGDVETGAAIDAVRRHFEEIPAGPSPPRAAGAGSGRASADISPTDRGFEHHGAAGAGSGREQADGPAEERKLLLEDRVELPRLYLAWRSPALFAEGDAGMDLLAHVLAGGKTSRLYRTLVRDRRIATDVSAAQSSREVGGWFCITATAAPGHGLDEIDAAVRAELADLAGDGPETDEIGRALAQVEAQFVYGLQTVGGFHGRSDQLNAYNVYTGDPGFVDRDLARYRGTDAGDVRALAGRLAPDARVALSIVPTGGNGLALAGSAPAEVS